MPRIERSALVAHPADAVYHLINDVASYPRRFVWCAGAEVQEASDTRVLARLDLRIGGISTWFTTENHVQEPSRIEMNLRDGPFRKLVGVWQFTPLAEDACKVSLVLDFEPNSRLLLPAFSLGLNKLADRMMQDFVRAADTDAA